MAKKSDTWKAVVVIALIIIVIAAVYFSYFFSFKCNTIECFQSHQKECAKTKYVNDAEDVTWEYFIMGMTRDQATPYTHSVLYIDFWSF